MYNNYVSFLLESAEKSGLISTLAAYGNDIKINIPLSQSLCDKSIDDMNLSVRASNGLKRCGAMTIRELTGAIMSEKGLETVRNLGKKSIGEIKTKLLCLAYSDLNNKEKIAFWNEFIELNPKCKVLV